MSRTRAQNRAIYERRVARGRELGLSARQSAGGGGELSASKLTDITSTAAFHKMSLDERQGVFKTLQRYPELLTRTRKSFRAGVTRGAILHNLDETAKRISAGHYYPLETQDELDDLKAYLADEGLWYH